MARRKPQHVERHRQQRQQRDRDENEAAAESQNDVAETTRHYEVIVVDDSDETESEVDEPPQPPSPPPAAKRMRMLMKTHFQGHGRRHDVMDNRLQLCPAQPSQLSSMYPPWSDTKRQAALWITFPLQDNSPVDLKLRQLDVGHVGVGFVSVSEEDTWDNTLTVCEFGGEGWSPSFDQLIRNDLVTMEIDSARNWRVGVDWETYMAQASQVGGPVGLRAHTVEATMRLFMVWVLHHSDETARCQWSYEYKDEIDAVYRHELLRDTSSTVEFDIHDVYARIDVATQLQRSVANLPMSKLDGVLLPTLRGYQKAGVSWMLSRENATTPAVSLPRSVRFENGSGPVLLYDPFCASFELEIRGGSLLKAIDLSSIRGGVLADEMGLGKTVEVITLVLSNPSPHTQPALISDVSSITSDDGPSYKSCICGSDKDEAAGWRSCTVCGTEHHRLCTSVTEADRDEEQDEDFVCFHCYRDHGLLSAAKTTLIVSPATIHDQWEAELRRHVKPGALSLLRFPGVKALNKQLQGRGPSSDWALLATSSALAAYDIVLTTYEVLGEDLYHVPTESGKERRRSTRQRKKKYAFVVSPLIFLRFWRICTDEAQVGVENETLRAALTVAKLKGMYHWVVTGTPFATQLSDLYGCLKFLKVIPYGVIGEDDEDGSEGRWWFREELEAMYLRGAIEKTMDMLLLGTGGISRGGGLLWRTRKRDVADQLQLPEQTQEVVWCRFSEVERMFYDREEAALVALLRAEEEERRRRRQQYADVTDDEEEEVTGNMWHRLLMLRQVCCHPGVGQTLNNTFGAGGGRRLGSGDSDEGGVLTMDEFLERLVGKSKLDCEDAQRQLLAALNGQAAIALLQHDVPSAVLKYLIAAEVIRRNWLTFRADLLPRLHIVEHLASSVRRHYGILTDSSSIEHDDEEENHDNPKEVSLMPELVTLRRAVADTGLLPVENVDLPSIACDCHALDTSAGVIRRFYLQQVRNGHAVAHAQFESTTGKVERAMEDKKMMFSSAGWWLEALQILRQQSVTDASTSLAVVDRIRAQLLSLGTKWSTAFAEKFHDIHGFSLALVQELESLAVARKKAIQKLRGMSAEPSVEEIHVSGNCRKCRDSRDGPVCGHCRFYKELEGYRQHLLGIDGRGGVDAVSSTAWTTDSVVLEESEASSSTTTASSSLVVDVLRQIMTGVRPLLQREPHRLGLSRAEGAQLVERIQLGFQQDNDLYGALLREWTKAKFLFQAQHRRLGALDELSMAKLQLRLRAPGETIRHATDRLYILEAHELSTKKLALEAERVAAEAELQEKHSHLKYLIHLQEKKKNQGQQADLDESSAAQEEDAAVEGMSTCVVCLEDMTNATVAVLPCAHMTCERCSNRLIRRSFPRALRCPTCRRLTLVEDRKLVFPEKEQRSRKQKAATAATASASTTTSSSTHKHPQAADQLLPLTRGGFGSKIDAVLRRVRALATAQPQLKALVFTQWQTMMTLVARALQMNGIKCFTYTGKRQFSSVLQQFKRSSEPCVLAMPFKEGANGVNIVEATEVLLLEPLLNTSIELQAINRVHRIGQTRVTKVHRFVVENSVEERISDLGSHGKRRHVIESDRHDEEEQKEDSEVDDNNDTEEESLVVSRQEKEKLTLAQLHTLLNYHKRSTREEEENFWMQSVLMNGARVTRRDACETRIRRDGAEQRVGGATRNPTTHVMGKTLPLFVAHDLLELSSVGEDQDAVMEESPGIEEVRQRVAEQVRLWFAAS